MDSENESSRSGFFQRNDKNDDLKESPQSGFFKWNDKNDDLKGSKDDSKDAEGKSKGIPIVGRFFATDEEKEERRQMKQEGKEEKERWKREAKAERKRRQQERKNQENEYSESDKKRNVIPNLKNYFKERQIRKDAEVLRFQVKRMEEERQKQVEKDAEELRLAVQQQELERKLQFPRLEKKFRLPTAPVSIPKEDIVRRKIQSQKELDLKRMERREKIREGTSKPSPIRPSEAAKKPPDDAQDGGGTKSSKFGSVVSAAQKLVSGVFDSNEEEWIVVAPKTRISPGEIVAVTAAGLDLLLVASKDGSAVHCVANSCPHLGTPLEVGTLERLPIEPPEPQKPSFPFGDGDDENDDPVQRKGFFEENDISRMLKRDGCEECIVCPLHKTAFALESGEVRGEWCPYPPVIGKLTGAVKQQANLPVFDVRTKGKNIEVRLNTSVETKEDSKKKNKG
eukprot:CAMPEP_0197179684 /NCGR_PEP_ID=MMETSP1423-20130617/4546_1 /TAXON_ID=476441 /ORGANISM="Pseudo-nitzschia heimii, Strain UNC1101" /LENGTH=452 /DNA_ID=CAMNT_0042629625 /DNA_START=693 /DNA_END=2051 /DNA_ORIENTATION=-